MIEVRICALAYELRLHMSFTPDSAEFPARLFKTGTPGTSGQISQVIFIQTTSAIHWAERVWSAIFADSRMERGAAAVGTMNRELLNTMPSWALAYRGTLVNFLLWLIARFALFSIHEH